MTCATCGTEFIKRTPHHRFCARNCQARAHYKNKPEAKRAYAKLYQRRSDVLKQITRERRFHKHYKKDEVTGCWNWTGFLDWHGYPRIDSRAAHRISYELFVGKIPEGLSIDHLCSTPRCVNPQHLEPVTNAENQRRRIARLRGEIPHSELKENK